METCDYMLIDPQTGRKYDYYKILGIEETEESATVIKRAYFAAAQKYHPDKNKDGKDTTAMFIYVYEAYTTLSSPQERAYYNRNRAYILQTIDDAFDNVETFVNIAALRRPQQNFYGVYDSAFAMLSDEEQKAANIRIELDYGLAADELQRCTFRITNPYPRFGDSHASKSYVSAFYAYWLSFATVKIFSHADQYTTKGENSRYRKLATGENERFRADARRAFSDKVRELVAYIQRRDERILKFEVYDAERQRQKEQQIKNDRELIKQQKQDAINQLFEQKELRRQELQTKLMAGTISYTELLEFEALSVKERALDKSVLKVAKELDYKQVKTESKKKLTIGQICADQSLIAAGADVDANGIIYCKVCSQRFNMIGEFKTHLSGKRHKKAIKEQDETSTKYLYEQQPYIVEADYHLSDEELALQKLEEELRQAMEDDKPEERAQKPREKRDSKRRRNISVEEADEGEVFKCRKCGAVFYSRSKLFDHLRSTGHAMVPK